MARSEHHKNNNGDATAPKLRVAVNSEIKYKADLNTDKRAAGSLTFNYKVMDLTIDELAARIRNRENIANECLAPDGSYHRKKEYFKRGDVVCIDVDNDGENYMSFDDARNHPFVKAHGTIIYTTASHKPDFHKFRLVFALEEPITDRARYERIVAALIWLFESDSACKDASRFFYGAGKNGQVIVLDNYLTNAAIDALLIEWELATAPKIDYEQARKDYWTGFVCDSAKAQDRRSRYAERAIEQATRIIDESIPPIGDIKGNRHHARTKAAYLLGGYVGGGILSHSEAREALAAAVSRNTDNFAAAMETIDACLEAGKAKPLTYEMKEAERWAYLSQKNQKVFISPKLEPISKPTNTVQLEPPTRPLNTIQLTTPSRPAATILLNTEVGR